MPPLTLPGLPAALGVPTEVPGAVVVPVVPVCVPSAHGFVVLVLGWVVVVVLGEVVVVVVPVCVPMPGLGVTVPVF